MKPEKRPLNVPAGSLPLPLWASLEVLESRLMLDGAPTFATPLADSYTLSETLGKAITLGIDGADPDGDALTINVTSDDPHVIVQMRAGQQTYARLNFVDGSGNPIGAVVVQLFTDVAPLAVQRFINLATKAVVGGAWATPDATHPAFYTNVLVHRVIPNFMMQTGDAVRGDGTGGSGLSATATGGEAPKFNDQFDPHLSFFSQGVLAMANSGTNTNDSQFFITTYPYVTGDGKYTIFGQVISGQDVADKITQSRRNSSDKPYEAIKLSSVDIINNDTQDATATMYATRGFDGHANVTVTLRDPAGHITTRQISVDRLSLDPVTGWGERPVVADLPTTPTHARPGTTGDIRINATDANMPSGTIDVTAATTVPGVTVSIAPSFSTHYLITYSLAADYSGPAVIPITVTAKEHALANVGDLPAKVYMTYLTTYGERPRITGIADDEVIRMQPGTTTTKTVTVTDDSHTHSNLTVTVSKTSTTAGVTTNVVAGDIPGTWDITITVPATYMSPAVPYRNGFDVTVKAVENVSGSNVTLTETSKTFHVSTLGADPVIGGIDDQVVLAPGDKRDIDLAITDDSSLELVVTATSDINGTGEEDKVVYLDSRTDNGNKIYTLHIDLTRRLPANFTGFFKVTLSAVEKVASTADATIKDAAKPTTRDIYVTVQYPGDPSLPDQVPTRNDAKVAVVSGQRLYVGTSKGIEIYDLSADAGNPTYLGKYDAPYEVRDIIVQGNTAYVGVYGSSFYGYVSAKGSVLTLDVTDPANITKLDEVKTDSLVNDMTLVGNTLYVADWTNGLTIYDVSNPSAVTESGWFLKDNAGHTLAQAAAVEVNGNYAYIADSGSPAGRVVVLNVVDPQHIFFVRQFYTSTISYVGRIRKVNLGTPSGLAMEGDRLYVSDSVNGLYIYDITRDDLPVQLGRAGWKSSAVRVQDDMAVLAYGGYHIVLNVEDPTNIMKVYAMYTPGYSGGAAIAGDYAYLPSQGEGLAVVDWAPLADSVMVDRAQTFADDANHSVTVQVAGPGEARIQKDVHGHITQINVTGTDATSRVILTGNAGSSIDDLYIAGPVGALIMPRVILAGDLVIQGQPRTVVLGDVANAPGAAEQTIRFEANGAIAARTAMTFTAGRLADVQISSDFPVTAFTAVDWRDDEGDGSAANVDTLTAPSVGVLRMTGRTGVVGNFQADLDLNAGGEATTGTVLGAAVIPGNISEANWDINGSVSRIQFSSAQDWDMAAAGKAGVVRALHDLDGTVTAGSFGQVIVPGALDATVTATGQTGGVSIGSLIAGNADDMAVSAPGGVVSVVAGQWTTGSLTAGWVSNLSVRGGAGRTGDMGATVDVTAGITSASIMGDLSGSWTSDTIGSLIVLGDMECATITLQRPASSTSLDLARLDVRGWIRDSEILSAGRVGTVAVGGMDSSHVYAGYIGAVDAVTGLPTAGQLGDGALFSQAGGLGSIRIRGIRSGAGYADSFIDSNIAAWTIGSAQLAYAALDAAPEAEPFGVAAHALGSYTYRDAAPANAVTWSSQSGGSPPAVDNLIVRLV